MLNQQSNFKLPYFYEAYQTEYKQKNFTHIGFDKQNKTEQTMQTGSDNKQNKKLKLT